MTLAAALAALLPASRYTLDPVECHVYGADNSRRHQMPAAVCWPESIADVQAAVKACIDSATALTVRGRGTATTGAAVPERGGLVLSLERMQRILRIEPADRYAVVEAGVLNGDLQTALRAHGLFWPPDPTSAPYSSIGGNLACNAGGPRTVKYGAARDNVLGLCVVDGHGALWCSGGRTSKGAVGYDLTRLLVGSEGTLGVIVEATLKLLPAPAARLGLYSSYTSVEAAAEAVAALMGQPEIPAALEFMDDRALDLLRRHRPDLELDGAALLLLEVDGAPERLREQAEHLAAAARVPGWSSTRIAQDAADSDRIWAARKALSPLLRHLAPGKINEDVVVPVSRIPPLVAALRRLEARFGLPILSFGHAGNGNLHVNVLYDPRQEPQARAAQAVLPELFGAVLALGGTLSGEHGIGLDKRAFVPQAIDAVALARMRALKAVFDPHGILNPSKVFPPAD